MATLCYAQNWPKYYIIWFKFNQLHWSYYYKRIYLELVQHLTNFRLNFNRNYFVFFTKLTTPWHITHFFASLTLNLSLRVQCEQNLTVNVAMEKTEAVKDQGFSTGRTIEILSLILVLHLLNFLTSEWFCCRELGSEDIRWRTFVTVIAFRIPEAFITSAASQLKLQRNPMRMKHIGIWEHFRQCIYLNVTAV